MTARKPKKRLPVKTLADVARNVRPIPTVKQIEADVARGTAGIYAPPVSTRDPVDDLLQAIALLLAFFLITHYFGWPI